MTPARAPVIPIAPSGPLAASTLDEGLAELEAMEIPWSWPPAGPDAVLDRDLWLAGDDAHRASALRSAIRAGDAPPNLWMARGGYGAIRTLRESGPGLLAERPTTLWGFSDGTLLLAAWDRMGWPAWLAPPLSQLPRLDLPSRARVRAAWHGDHVAPFEDLETLAPGHATGPLGGGNLCVLASALGTPWAADLRGRIVILEDTGEPPYKVDRLFTQLWLSGALDEAAGIVLGGFTALSADGPPVIRAFFAREAPALGLPVAWGLPVGHDVNNAPLPYGAATGHRARLDAPGDGGPARLTFEPC